MDRITIGPDGIPTYLMLINGRWVEAQGGKTFAVKNPATGKVIARVPDSSSEDVQRAIAAAAEAKAAMQELEPVERLERLDKAHALFQESKAELLQTLIRESGKPVSVAEGEVRATAERMRLALQEARELYGQYIPGGWVEDTVGKFAIVIRRPRGVIAAISSFNYPLFIPSAKIIPALLAANTVIAKPSSKTPLSLLLFCHILQAAGFPAGAINVITGGGGMIGEQLSISEKVDMITFTGSTDTGKQIAKWATMKKLHLELGGKAAAIILPDADLGRAARECVRGAFRNSGQRCDAVSRVLLHESAAERFIELALAETANYKTGDPEDPGTQVGPLIDRAAVNHVDSLVNDALTKGAKLLTGGRQQGLFYEPTILDRVTEEMRIAQEEIFGPVLPLIRYREVNEAVRIANASRLGLDSCLFTENLTQAIEIAKRLEDGSVTLNGAPAHGVGHFPFGGNKESGIGREGLGYGIDEMTKIHTIVFNVKPRK